MSIDVISVHFPKSGGSSLKKSFIDAFGPNSIYLDYEDDPVDPLSLFSIDPEYCIRNARLKDYSDSIKLVHGHFSPRKYSLFTESKFITFLRNPIDNLISLYYFWKTYDGKSHKVFDHFRDNNLSILELAKIPTISHLYSSTYFGKFEMERFDFIGFYENYSSDITRLGRFLGIDIKENNTNTNKSNNYHDNVASIKSNHKLVSELQDVLRDDLDFYDRLRTNYLHSNTSTFGILPQDEFLFTGERYHPEIKGNIYLEHVHRYQFAKSFTKDKLVVDIACGEGFGTNILGENASSVIGIDVSTEAIEHAKKKYGKSNLDFQVGKCEEIPIPTGTVDVVVSFETIEHHSRHDEMLSEIKRILKPDGILIISSPDKMNYSVNTNRINPFHVKELFVEEFTKLLHDHFPYCVVFGQRIMYGSVIAPEIQKSMFCDFRTELLSENKTNGIFSPLYNIAICSNTLPMMIESSIFEQPIDECETVLAWREKVTDFEDTLAKTELLITKAIMEGEKLLSGDELTGIELNSELLANWLQRDGLYEYLPGREVLYDLLKKGVYLSSILEMNQRDDKSPENTSICSSNDDDLSEAHTRDLVSELNNLRMEVVRYELSHSWQITRPLRILFRKLSRR